jgi:membrane protease YdiL (CAAX protease family)
VEASSPLSPARRETPRVWPVFAVCAVVGLGLLALGASSFLWFARHELIRSGMEGEKLTPKLAGSLAQDALASPLFLGGVSLVSSLVLLCVAAVAGPPAPADATARVSRVSLPAVFVASLGVLGLAQSLDTLVDWCRWSRFSHTLPALRDVIGQLDSHWRPAAITVFALLPALSQELFFRGFVQTRLSLRWGPLAGVIVSAGLGALFHPDPLGASLALLMGLALGALVERAGSVWPAVVAHLLANIVWVLGSAGVLSFALPGVWRLAAPLVLAISALVLLWPEPAPTDAAPA